jgi:hypothetical protein
MMRLPRSNRTSLREFEVRNKRNDGIGRMRI